MRPRTSSLLALAVLLTACTAAPVTAPVDTGARETDAIAAFERGDLIAARDIYARLVARSQGMDRIRFRIGLARAEAGLGNAQAALAELDDITGPLPAALESELALVRAMAFFTLGRTVEAVSLLVEREIWLESPAEISENHSIIWDGLSLPISLAGAQQRTGDDIVDGWLALAPMTRMTDDNGELRSALVGWREEFPNHPAVGTVLVERLAELRGEAPRPNRIAVLLPTSSAETRTQALAVQWGIMAAHAQSGPDDQTSIQFYDTTQRGSVESFLTAQLESADFIVGPLISGDVTEVEKQAGFVPTLALNVADTPSVAPPDFYQFALSSDDEVEAIAARAIADGHETAAILFANTTRGYRARDGFVAAYESRGGRIVNATAYVRSEDLSAPIEQLLNITASEERHRRLERDLGLQGDIAFQSRRRGDIDMIFLQIDPSDGPAMARLLLPLLRDDGAGDIPTYAMSVVYDPTRTDPEPDLDGLIFPDLPLLIDPAGRGRAAASALGQFTPLSAEQQQRLFAFGYDAFRLVNALAASGRGSAVWPISGATGDLYLGDNGRIRRVLPFAQFRDGRPEALTTTLGPFGSR